MTKIILTGVDGNLGNQAAQYLLKLADLKQLIFCGYDKSVLKEFEKQDIQTQQTDFNVVDGLAEKFSGGDILGLVSMPFVGKKRQHAHKNVIDAAKQAGVSKIVYTSLVNASDPTNPSVEKIDHAFTEDYIKKSGLDYIFLRNSQYAEAMITNYFSFANQNKDLANNQANGKMAYISRKDCAKALAYALVTDKYHQAILNINGKDLLTISEFIAIGNSVTGNHIGYQEVTDEENYAIFDSMGVPRNTDGNFKSDSEAPYSSDGMVTFAQAIRENKMDSFTNDFFQLTGDSPISVKYMFQNEKDFQVGERHSKE